jgi:chemotaxis family two-component system sensor kinase Cph1
VENITVPSRSQALTDLTICDREPIHIPGSIQPHGILFALHGVDHRITAVGVNVAVHFGHEPSDLLGIPFSRLFDEQSVAVISRTAAQTVGGLPRLVRIRLTDGTGPEWRAFVHTSPNGIILEAKLPQPRSELDVLDFLETYDGSTRRLQAAGDVAAICTCLAEEVRSLTGYDRVKVYRFAADWHGEVVAEANAGKLPSYLGLHFPASDIPVQARALYTRNFERQIPDVSYTPVPLIGIGTDPLDLSQAMLRSVSPVHIEYLHNMQVDASMSVSILRQGALWGLVACHHHTSHYVPPEMRQASVLLAQLASWQLGVAEETDIVRRSVGVKAVEALLLQETTAGRDYREALLTHSNVLLDLLDASGFALSHGGSVTTIGQTLPDDELGDLLTWLADKNTALFETNNLASAYPAAVDRPHAAGIIAVSLGGASKDLMVWFRPEIAKTVTWGGNPHKQVEPLGREERLNPRKSFASWTQDVQGHSRPWARHETAAANGLRDMIVDIILRRSAELEQLNAQLVRTNEELEAFAYVASHDLKEPLRQIETFGTLLERVFRDRTAAPGDITRWFDGIQTSSRRLRTLINDLAEYSRLGRHANPFAPVSLDELLENVKTI